jgi:SAM-dependent methyltransferase
LTSSYDEIAEMYHTLWANWYLPAVRGALDELFFKRLKAGEWVLDVCCGSGHVTRELVARGLKVTGVDSSAGLIEIARAELPGVDFRVQDARCLALDANYDAALSTFDSLNHILLLDELREAFRAVYAVLKPGSFFLFDMNLEEAYRLDLHQWNVTITDESVGLVRGIYDRESKIASTELIWFQNARGQENCWKQYKSVVKQRCYAEHEIIDALREAGFESVTAIPANRTEMTSDFAFGRSFFVAERQPREQGGRRAA